MGFKLNMLILKGQNDIDSNTLLRKIGFNYGKRTYERIGSTTLDNCLNPLDNEHMYIGSYQDLKIITEANLPMEFLNESPSFTEIFWRTLTIGNRPTYVFTLNSTINLWGYSGLIGHERIRTKFGTHDKGVIHEEGNPFKSELELIEKSEIVKGKRVYEIEGENYHEDQIGEEFVFRIIEELTGQRLDIENDLLNTEMLIYKMIEKKGIEDMLNRIRG